MSNKITRILALLMVSLALLSAPMLSESIDTPFAVTASAAAKKTPVLSAKKKTVYYKGTTTLKVKNYTKKVKWSTSNKKVAKVNSKGKVTAVGLGTCTITAKVGSKKLKCKITVKDRNVTSAVSFKVNGGYFVKGESSATVTVKPKKYNAAKATVYIQNAEGKTVYKKTLTKLTKGKKYSFTWNGKNTKGKYVSGGSYRVKVKIGKKESYSSYLTFYAVNDFADGCGSSSNPFIVQTGTHLKKIVKYPTAYFKQANDINFNYTAVGGLFSADQPFNGTYDGNGKTIMNISATMPLFNTIGEKGTIKNLNMKGCSVSTATQYAGLLVFDNKGIVSNCCFEKCAISANYGGQHRLTGYFGMVSGKNSGTIKSCVLDGEVSGTINSSYSNPYCAGIVGLNETSGKVIDCTVNAKIASHTWDYPKVAGVVGYNKGLISNCEATGDLIADIWWHTGEAQIGGVTVQNNGQVLNCCYTGSTQCNLVAQNSGNIM